MEGVAEQNKGHVQWYTHTHTEEREGCTLVTATSELG